MATYVVALELPLFRCRGVEHFERACGRPDMDFNV